MAQLTVPSVTDLYNAFIDDFVSRTGPKTPLLKSAFVRLLAWPFAGLTVLCYRYGQYVYFEMFLESCSFEALKKYGSRVGVDWQAGTPTVATVTLTGVTAISIPSGALFTSSNGTVFKTSGSTPVSSGTAVCTVTSTTTGVQTNVNVGDEMGIALVLAGVPSTGIVSGVSEEGEDPQSVEEYRAEVRQRYRLQPQGGAFADYWIWATEVDGIADALVYVTQPGIVDVYPVETGSGSARIPGATKLAEVEASLTRSPNSSVDDRHPVQAQLNVAAPSTNTYSVAIGGLSSSANTTQNRLDIKAGIVEYFDTRRPQIPALGYTAAGGAVTTAEVTGAVIDVLANSTDPGTYTSLSVKLGGVDIGAKSVLPVGTLAQLGTLTINGSAVV